MEIKHSVVILTKNKPHHWYFISELAKVSDIKAIIIDQPKKNISLKKIFRHGFFWTLLKIFEKFKCYSTYEIELELKKYRPHFHHKDSKNKYRHLINNVKNVNSQDTKKLIRDISPDYICSLGGGIIDEEGIKLAKIGALNLHSGISPFYNGADSIDKVIESRNLNFIGCTLMLLSHKIDSGPILAHYFTGIEVTDSPNSLFCKTILGGIKIYTDFLLSEQSMNPASLNLVSQKKPIHYYLGYDHTLLTNLVIKYFFRHQMINKFIRDEISIKYFEKKTDFNYLLKITNVIY